MTTLSSIGMGQSSSGTSSSAKHPSHPFNATKPALDAGGVVNGYYQNRTLALSCKMPAGWVLRTEEINAEESGGSGASTTGSASAASSAGARVLLATFSRPPDARGEDVNASILIAAENQSVYPGLKDAAQYFGPLSEVAKTQGFTADEDPYEIAVGKRTLVRGDFHKNVGTRVMHQSTLAMLERGYAVSITVIGGTEDEVEELIDGLSFGSSAK